MNLSTCFRCPFLPHQTILSTEISFTNITNDSCFIFGLPNEHSFLATQLPLYLYLPKPLRQNIRMTIPPSPPSSSQSTSPNDSKHRPESREPKETIHHGRTVASANKSPTIIPGQAPEEIIEPSPFQSHNSWRNPGPEHILTA